MQLRDQLARGNSLCQTKRSYAVYDFLEAQAPTAQSKLPCDFNYLVGYIAAATAHDCQPVILCNEVVKEICDLMGIQGRGPRSVPHKILEKLLLEANCCSTSFGSSKHKLNFDYPHRTDGIKYARELRARANHIGDKAREHLLNRAMSRIMARSRPRLNGRR